MLCVHAARAMVPRAMVPRVMVPRAIRRVTRGREQITHCGWHCCELAGARASVAAAGANVWWRHAHALHRSASPSSPPPPAATAASTAVSAARGATCSRSQPQAFGFRPECLNSCNLLPRMQKRRGSLQPHVMTRAAWCADALADARLHERAARCERTQLVAYARRACPLTKLRKAWCMRSWQTSATSATAHALAVHRVTAATEPMAAADDRDGPALAAAGRHDQAGG